VSDLAISLHRLLGARGRVRWGWLAPLAAVVALLKIITQWWAWYGAAKIAQGLTFEMFVGVIVNAVLLFLISAAALPDKADEPVVDLQAHYWRIARQYWILFTAYGVSGLGISLWAQMAAGARFAFSPEMIGAIAIPLAALSLVFVRNRWWHTLCLVAFIAVYCAQSFGQTLA
jgi:hypothetical protein